MIFNNILDRHKVSLEKSILIILFLSVLVGLIVAWNTPAIGYESSIYASTPAILWIILIVSVLIGISIIIFSLTSNSVKNSMWKIGFLLIFLCYAIGLSIFIIRGYYMWCMGGDPAEHLGTIIQIIEDGILPLDLIYPLLHIFLAEISIISTITPFWLHKIIPLLFGLLCIFFILIFYRCIIPNLLGMIIAGLISCTYVLGWYLNLTPNALSNLLFPIVLFLVFKYLKENSISWGILLIVMIFLYPIFHPVPTLFFGLTLIALCIPHIIYQIFKGEKFQNLKLLNEKIIIPTVILFIWTVTWISLYWAWGHTVTNIYQKIGGEIGPSQLSNTMNQVSYAQNYGYNVFEIFLKQYSGAFVLTTLSLIAFFLIWREYSDEKSLKWIFSLYGPLSMLCILMSSLFLLNLAFGPLRLVVYASILGIVLGAYLLSYFLILNQKTNLKTISNIIVIVLLTSMFLFGLLNLYPSPYNLKLNYQTTQNEAVGMHFFYKNRDVTKAVSGISGTVGTFMNIFLKPDQRTIQDLPAYLGTADIAPWRFGYDKNSSIAISYKKETDLIITERDKLIYTDYYPTIAKIRFLPEDFEQLNNDHGASRLYSNGGFDLYKINVD